MPIWDTKMYGVRYLKIFIYDYKVLGNGKYAYRRHALTIIFFCHSSNGTQADRCQKKNCSS